MRRQVGWNAALNVLGVVLPTLVGILAVPMLLHNLGADRLGIFTLALGIIGFAGVFDLGLGRALTQSVATATGQGRTIAVIARHVRSTLPIVLLMGVGWGALLWLAAEPVSHSVFRLDGVLADEAVTSVRWLAIAIPGLLLSGSLVGVLEGLQRFGLVNLLRVPLGVLAFLIPALASCIWKDVGLVIGILVIVRLIGVMVCLWAVSRVLPLMMPPAPGCDDFLDRGGMWRFTGWLTVSNIVGPLMVHADRFYLASLFPPATVAHYAVPLDTLFRATALPVAAMNAIFPALAHAGTASAAAERMIQGAAWFMFALWTLPILLAGFILEWLLTFWLGAAFAAEALGVSQWLLLGVLINGFAHIPYALLQSAGRADLTAKLHVLELPVYTVLIVALVAAFGIVGAAIAWSARVVIDTLLLYWMAHRQFALMRPQLLLAVTIAAGAALLLWIITLA
ncbi:hypothetical protein [Geopseudomonas aromaticivorans]